MLQRMNIHSFSLGPGRGLGAETPGEQARRLRGEETVTQLRRGDIRAVTTDSQDMRGRSRDCPCVWEACRASGTPSPRTWCLSWESMKNQTLTE